MGFERKTSNWETKLRPWPLPLNVIIDGKADRPVYKTGKSRVLKIVRGKP